MQKMAYSLKPYRPLLRNTGMTQSADGRNSDAIEDDSDGGEEEAKASGQNARLGWLDHLRSVFGFVAVRRESPA